MPRPTPQLTPTKAQLFRICDTQRGLAITINPHRRFYEALEGRYVGEIPYAWKGVPLSEAMYGRDELTHPVLSGCTPVAGVVMVAASARARSAAVPT